MSTVLTHGDVECQAYHISPLRDRDMCIRTIVIVFHRLSRSADWTSPSDLTALNEQLQHEDLDASNQ